MCWICQWLGCQLIRLACTTTTLICEPGWVVFKEWKGVSVFDRRPLSRRKKGRKKDLVIKVEDHVKNCSREPVFDWAHPLECEKQKELHKSKSHHIHTSISVGSGPNLDIHVLGPTVVSIYHVLLIWGGTPFLPSGCCSECFLQSRYSLFFFLSSVGLRLWNIASVKQDVSIGSEWHLFKDYSCKHIYLGLMRYLCTIHRI